MSSKQRWGCGIALVLAFVAVVGVPVLLLGALGRMVAGELQLDPPPRTLPRFSETVVDGQWERRQPERGKIVVIPITGVITNFAPSGLLGGGGESMVERVRRQLRQARTDDNVKAIVLHVNSPGGEVTASDHLYQAVVEAAASKPVVAYFDSVAASGGYYLACGATAIVASETGITGSIGVIIQSLNYSELFDKAGLETLTFASGEFKDTLSGSRAMREDEQDYVRQLVAGMYERFVQLVAEGRDIPVDQVRREVADGRVFTGTEALELNLVDATGSIHHAYAKARQLADAEQAVVVRYGSGGGSLSRLLSAAETQADHLGADPKRRLELDLSPSLLPRLRPGVPYYLAPGMAGWE